MNFPRGINAAGERVPRGPGKLKREPLLKACDDAGYDPQTAMIQIAKGELDCLKCFGAGEAWYPKTDGDGVRMRKPDGTIERVLRLCESCYGSGREKMDVTDVLKARIAIMDKIVPSLKQVDHSNEDGSLNPGWKMVIVQAEALKPGSGKTPPMLQQKRDD